jgi:predicted transcriptional regulator
MFIILLLWTSRYDYYSKKEFDTNFKNSPLKFLKYNNMLISEGYVSKWEMRRSTYFISAKGKEMVDKINKFVNKRVNG